MAGKNYIIRLRGYIAIILLGCLAFATVADAATLPAENSIQVSLAHHEQDSHTSSAGTSTEDPLCVSACGSHTMCGQCFGVLASGTSSPRTSSNIQFPDLVSTYYQRFIPLDLPPPKNQLI